MLIPTTALLALMIAGAAQAAGHRRKQPASYRYGELASFAEYMDNIELSKALAESYPSLERHNSDKKGSNPYGNISNRRKVRRGMRREKKALKLHSDDFNSKPASYRYGLKATEAVLEQLKFNKDANPKLRSKKRSVKPSRVPNVLVLPHSSKQSSALKGASKIAFNKHKNYCPPSYSYGQKVVKGDLKHEGKKPFKVVTVIFDKHNKSTKKMYNPPSYNYGRHYENKLKSGKKIIGGVIHPIMNGQHHSILQQIITIRDTPVGVKSRKRNHRFPAERNMNSRPHGRPFPRDPKIEGESIIEFFEGGNGEIKSAEKEFVVVEFDHGPSLHETFIKLEAHEADEYVMEGSLHIFSKPGFEGKLASRKPLSRFERFFGNTLESQPFDGDSKAFNGRKFKAAGFDLNLDNEFKRMGVALILGIFATISLMLFGKLLFATWTGLDTRRKSEDNENRILLGQEFDSSAHPISIVYKN